MVKRRKKNTRKNRNRKGFSQNRAKARNINASTAYETCTEQLSPFGGLLALIKFLDLVNFHKIFNFAYQPASRKPKLGHYSMMVGVLMLLAMIWLIQLIISSLYNNFHFNRGIIDVLDFCTC